MKFLLSSLFSALMLVGAPSPIMLETCLPKLVAVAPAPKDMPKGAHCNMMLMAQQGNPGHKEPPPGWKCAGGHADDKDKPCTCHRECKDVEDTDEFGEPNGKMRTVVKEDPQCSSYCFQDHCACGVKNCD